MKMVCPHCGLGGTAHASLYGRKVRCPECRRVFRATGEVVVEPFPETAGVIEQSLMGDEMPAGVDQGAEAVGADDGGGEVDTGRCSKCGFKLSRDYIRLVDNRPVCMACAA